MISVVIPLMPIKPYCDMVYDCIESLERQTVDIEIIVSKHEVEDYIRKNHLLNEGVKKSKGDIIWFCDADFTIDDKNFLKNMKKKLKDVIFPYFWSIKGKLKVADGAPMVRKSVLERFGKFDESLIGISWVTFPFLKWCIKNTDFKCDKRFVVNHHRADCRKKRHFATGSKLRSTYHQVSNELSTL